MIYIAQDTAANTGVSILAALPLFIMQVPDTVWLGVVLWAIGQLLVFVRWYLDKKRK